MSRILDLPPVIEMTTLRAAFPTYQFRVIMLGDRRRYEAIRRRDAIGPIFCLISVSTREIYLELSGANGVSGPQNG